MQNHGVRDCRTQVEKEEKAVAELTTTEGLYDTREPWWQVPHVVPAFKER